MAVSLFSPSFITKPQEERALILEQLGDEQVEQFNRLDKQLYSLDMASFSTMLDYLRENWDEGQKDTV